MTTEKSITPAAVWDRMVARPVDDLIEVVKEKLTADDLDIETENDGESFSVCIDVKFESHLRPHLRNRLAELGWYNIQMATLGDHVEITMSGDATG